nr:unnamed protein product [Digitaria exilis]
MPPPMHSRFLLLRSQTLTPLLRRSPSSPLLCGPRRCVSARASAARVAAAGVATTQQPELGMEEAVVGFVTGKRKATERELVKLFAICHSRMEDIVPKDAPVRLVAFNLGYLPGGDKTLITVPRTTELALEAASRILSSGGLISILVYIGHEGGR